MHVGVVEDVYLGTWAYTVIFYIFLIPNIIEGSATYLRIFTENSQAYRSAHGIAEFPDIYSMYAE